MAKVNREQLSAYLDDAMSDVETAEVERSLRESDALRRQLRGVMTERDKGEHSIGAIWRRQRLSCPGRDHLGSYLLQVLDADRQDYITFHLQTVGCPFCQANLADLKALQQEDKPRSQARRQRFFESSAGLLRARRDGK